MIPKKNPCLYLPLLFFLMFSLSCFTACQRKSYDNDTELSFAFSGDFQIGYSAWQQTKEENPSSTNIPQLRRNIKDIASVRNQLSFMVLLGDLVMNEVEDQGETLKIQLDAWQQVVQAVPEYGLVPLLPFTGNHETNIYWTNLQVQAPSLYTFDVWEEWLMGNGYSGFAGNGPRPTEGNPDRLARNESLLTYSFDVGNVHFVIINTDTLTTEINPDTNLPYAAWIPINWITADIEAAQQNQAINTIIVMGHRVIEWPAYADANWNAGIINTKEYPFASRLSEIMRLNSKVKAYLCSHLHSWHAWRLEDGMGVWQIIAGNGGAESDSDWNPPGGPYFGFSLMDIQKSGKIIVRSFGRPVPSPPQKFYEDSPVAPERAVLKEAVIIPD